MTENGFTHEENSITYQVTVTPEKTEWRLNGKRHREDGPAIECNDGYKEWYLNGKRHRVDGPAIEHNDGYKAWYLNGKRHRVDGPAIEHNDGYKAWYLNGKLHRVDGPALEHSDGSKEWWIDGTQYTEAEFLEKTKSVKELTIVEVEKLLGYPVKIVK